MLPPVIFFLLFLSFLIVCFQIALKGLEFSEWRVKPVLDVIVYSTGHEFLYLHPLVAVLLMKFHKLKVLSKSPLLLIQVRIDIVVPPFSALLTDASRQKCSDFLPFFEAELSYFVLEHHVFLWCPIAFNLFHSTILSLISKLEPTVHAVDILPIWHIYVILLDLLIQELADDFYVLNLVMLDKLDELQVQFSCPGDWWNVLFLLDLG